MKNTLLTLLTMLALGLVVTSCEQADEITPNGQTTASKVTPTGAPEIIGFSFTLDMDLPMDFTQNFAVEIININPGHEGIRTVYHNECPVSIPIYTRDNVVPQLVGVWIVPTLASMPYIDGFWDENSSPGHPSSHNDTYHYALGSYVGKSMFVTPIFRAPNRPAYTLSDPLIHLGFYVGYSAFDKVSCTLSGTKYLPHYLSTGIGSFSEGGNGNCWIVDNVIKTYPATINIKNISNESRTYTISSSFYNNSVTLSPNQTRTFTLPLVQLEGRLGVITVN